MRLLHSLYDNPAHWANAGIFKRPEFGMASFQKRINRIVGTAHAQPIVRLSWAWDCRKWENTEWNFAGVATAGEWRQRYRALSIDIGGDDYVDISPPRWVLEERYEPEALAASWELTRYRRVVTETPPSICRHCHSFKWISVDQSEGHLLVCRFCSEYTELATVNQDVWGEVPRGGWYNLLPHVGIIADHRNSCCQKAKDLGEICYGTYKLPDGKELSSLERAISLRNKDAATNPHISPELDTVALDQAKRWGLQMMQDAKVKTRGELAEIRRAHKQPSRLYA